MTKAETENQRLLRISREVYAEDGPAEKALRAKCQWEHMTRMGVIKELGDPREWDLSVWKEGASDE